MKSYKISDGVYFVGAIDYDLRVFDIIMDTEFGSTYNSYLIVGSEKTALIDTAKEPFKKEFFERINEIVDIKNINYLIVNHAEPDHSGCVEYVLEQNPDIEIFGSIPAYMKFKRNRK